MLSKAKQKGFTWTGWITPVNVKKCNYHSIGWNFGDKFDGFHEWDFINGKKVKCQLSDKKTKKCKHCGFYRE
jgi:hypothetical protein